MKEKTIILVGTFDTKSKEYAYVKELIERNGFRTITIDVGTGARGTPVLIPDYSKEEVAEMAGSSMEEVISFGETGQEMKIMGIMSTGAMKICEQLYKTGKLDGILSLGGTMGTNLGTAVMRSLPFGLPKVMVSTIASGDTRPFIGTKDIIMIPSIGDLAGLNRITKNSLTKAAGAILGIVSTEQPEISESPPIGITTLGGTTSCALHVKERIEEKGFEGVVFHTANGSGGKAMEELIEEGIIVGVFDLSTNEVVDHLYGGWSDAGPTRLEIAGRKGIPQLVAPGNIDHIQYSREDEIPERFRHQYIHRHGPSILILRTKKNEMAEVGRVMAKKLNKAKGPTAVIFPLKGLSILDKVDDEFNDPEANEAFFESLAENLRSDIKIKRVDAHITDSAFAEEAAEMLYKLVGDKKLNQ